MTLKYNNTTINSGGSVVFNGTSLTKVVCDGVTVWEKAADFDGASIIVLFASIHIDVRRSSGTLVADSSMTATRVDAAQSSWSIIYDYGYFLQTHPLVSTNPAMTGYSYFRTSLSSGSSATAKVTFRDGTTTMSICLVRVTYRKESGWDLDIRLNSSIDLNDVRYVDLPALSVTGQSVQLNYES